MTAVNLASGAPPRFHQPIGREPHVVEPESTNKLNLAIELIVELTWPGKAQAEHHGKQVSQIMPGLQHFPSGPDFGILQPYHRSQHPLDGTPRQIDAACEISLTENEKRLFDSLERAASVFGLAELADSPRLSPTSHQTIPV